MFESGFRLVALLDIELLLGSLFVDSPIRKGGRLIY
jgi:hypothetical protein